jgi:hypothetical protein
LPADGKELPFEAEACCLAATALRAGLPASFNAPAKSWLLLPEFCDATDAAD